jgi:dihydroxy-acid dehydratase
MASVVEAMGLSLPTNAALPAVDARRMALSHMTGKRIVQMVHEDLRLSKVLTKKNFENGIIANAAVGGSTNAVVHLLAIAGRAGIDLTLDDFDRVGGQIPCIVNCMPSGKYLIEDLAYAGGLPAVMNRIQDMMHADAPTVMGCPISDYWKDAEVYNDDVIRPLDNPLRERAGIRVLKGNLSPNGAVIKPSAASEHLLAHEGPAYVFETIEDMKAKIDDPDLPVTEDTILVLKGCGPKGYPGMAEVGNMPIPRRLVEKGVRDMVRISDARMSGTAFGTVVLHVSPEANAGGPLAIVKTGDRIRLDAMKGELNLLISEGEFAARMAVWHAPEQKWTRGYYKLYHDTVLQADKGADLDFLVGASGSEVFRESH